MGDEQDPVALGVVQRMASLLARGFTNSRCSWRLEGETPTTVDPVLGSAGASRRLPDHSKPG
jgi:hypothetical protein